VSACWPAAAGWGSAGAPARMQDRHTHTKGYVRRCDTVARCAQHCSAVGCMQWLFRFTARNVSLPHFSHAQHTTWHRLPAAIKYRLRLTMAKPLQLVPSCTCRPPLPKSQPASQSASQPTSMRCKENRFWVPTSALRSASSASMPAQRSSTALWRAVT
jgi:hypothetical protein